MPPPSGVTPSFYGPLDTIQRKIIDTFVITLAIATLTLCLRFYTRGWIVGSVGLDDFLLNFTLKLMRPVAIHFGFGRHLWDVPASEFKQYLKLVAPASCVYVWTLTITKLSLLLLYQRLNPHRLFRFCVYAVMFILIAYTVSDTIIVAAGCSAVDSTKGGCLNTLSITQSIVNIICDVLIMILPIPLVWSLQLPIIQKILLALVFASGSMVVIASSIRVKYILQLRGVKDVTYIEGNAGLWSAVEVNVGLICNCMVVMKPFFRRHLSGLLGSPGTNSTHAPPFSGIGSQSSRFKRKSIPPSYRLGSMDRFTHPGNGGLQVPPRSINVSQTFSVVRHKANGDFDTESTEDMIKDAVQGSLREGGEVV
ncbi:hypothetical protein K432DRAFT_298591 [Lepidopterella palustris CBS 459.81]|uniref:Rhodopsin domain-containing protein n=1 Tax=Lepidopterella palustris CBS 459.81 TaxID=1314670 RepID=A0A8E2JET3_9PEZI|nr:hypothetical protein K432DRAFT_298591 [Lepidopterella palustris CBS 459.81]